MRVVRKTPDGKTVILDTSTDECLYRAARNPPNTGTAFTTGRDLYRHVSKSGKAYYYIYGWSMWAGDSPYIELISDEEAKEFLLQKAASASPYVKLSEDEWKRAEELFPGIFDENA